jgi:hypothetical protein
MNWMEAFTFGLVDGILQLAVDSRKPLLEWIFCKN